MEKLFLKTSLNICEVVKEHSLFYEVLENKHICCIYKNDLWIKEKSNKIETLFDKYVIVENGKYKALKKINRKSLSKDSKVYGAIWTKKGLINVAEMDEKGNFILIDTLLI